MLLGRTRECRSQEEDTGEDTEGLPGAENEEDVGRGDPRHLPRDQRRMREDQGTDGEISQICHKSLTSRYIYAN